MKKHSANKNIDNGLQQFAWDILLNEIRKTYFELQERPCNPSAVEYLSTLVAAYVLEKEFNREIQECFISLSAFWKKYGICSPSHLSRVIKQHSLLQSACTIRMNGKWFVRPKTLIKFIASAKIGDELWKRCENWLRSEK